jgi:hypothetical protein
MRKHVASFLPKNKAMRQDAPLCTAAPRTKTGRAPGAGGGAAGRAAARAGARRGHGIGTGTGDLWLLKLSAGRGVRFPNVEELYNGTVTAASVTR